MFAEFRHDASTAEEAVNEAKQASGSIYWPLTADATSHVILDRGIRSRKTKVHLGGLKQRA